MKSLIEKYNKDIIDFVIRVDNLTEEEIKDIDYLEDRIQTHLDILDLEELREVIYNQVIQNYSELEEEFEGDELQNKINEIVDREINEIIN